MVPHLSHLHSNLPRALPFLSFDDELIALAPVFTLEASRFDSRDRCIISCSAVGEVELGVDLSRQTGVHEEVEWASSEGEDERGSGWNGSEIVYGRSGGLGRSGGIAFEHRRALFLG